MVETSSYMYMVERYDRDPSTMVERYGRKVGVETSSYGT